MGKTTVKKQNEYQHYLLFFLALLALPLAYLLLRLVPLNQRREYADICTSLPKNLTIINRFHSEQGDLIPYTCWGTEGEFRYGLAPALRDHFVTKKPKAKPLKFNSDTSFFDQYMYLLARSGLAKHLHQPQFKMQMLELLEIFNLVYSVAENKKVGLRCGESRDLTIARIMAHHLEQLDNIPDFLYINFSFDTDKPVNPDDLNVMTDHGTLLLLDPSTVTALKIDTLFNIENNFELSNAKANVSDKMALVVRRLLNPDKAGLAFQCDAWLPIAGVITQKDFGHCTNELFIKYPDKVESIKLLSLQKNPLIPPLINAFFAKYPDILNWLLEPGQPQKEMRHAGKAGFK